MSDAPPDAASSTRTGPLEVSLEATAPATAVSFVRGDAPATAVSFLRGDGSIVSASSLLSAKQPPEASGSRRVRRFYKSQNEFIDALVADIESSEQRHLLDGAADDSSPDRVPWQVRAAIRGSFFLNVALLLAKVPYQNRT